MLLAEVLRSMSFSNEKEGFRCEIISPKAEIYRKASSASPFFVGIAGNKIDQ
jgi:hypothetical protein